MDRQKFKNKILNALNIAMYFGYDNSSMGAMEAHQGESVCTLIGADSDEVIAGEILWVIVEEDDLDYFRQKAEPDRDYPFGDKNQRIFVYFA